MLLKALVNWWGVAIMAIINTKSVSDKVCLLRALARTVHDCRHRISEYTAGMAIHELVLSNVWATACGSVHL